MEGTIGEQAVLLELVERFTVKASRLMSAPGYGLCRLIIRATLFRDDLLLSPKECT